jgi:hypothetical protein
MAERTCPTCGDPFTPTRGRRFCSEQCWPSRRPRFADPDMIAYEGPADRAEVIDLLFGMPPEEAA